MSKILLIEQDSFFADLISQKLLSNGFETEVVGKGSEALGRIKGFGPDLILLDMEMTSTNPMTLLQEKNKNKEISSIPIITISRSAELSEIKKIVDLGVKDYLVKTQLNLDDLVKKINTHVKSSSTDKKSGNKPLEGKTVMWVEDDQFLSDLISRKLSTQGCKLLFANTGEEALKTLDANTPNIVILDILLPGISGFDVLEKMKSDERLRTIPVLILSNFSQNNEIDRSKKLGANRFLVKASIVLDDLVRELQAVLHETKS